MRLIDADEAIINFGFEWDDIPPTREEFVRFLRKQPTADAVVVTRCKDCENSYEDAFGRVCAYGICVDCTVPDDFYCASSKPKEGTC